MLKRLTVQNVALIDRAELEFSEGLNVLTGETGAGKSVILDSIDFVLGAKADKSMVRSGEDAAFVCAEFTSDSEEVNDLLREYDIEPEDTLLLARKLTADGRSSLKLNGVPVTAGMLRRVTSLLVDVHGQSEHFFLLKESNQLRLLDSLGGEPVAAAKRETARLLEARKKILAEMQKLGGDAGERDRRLDILKFQIDEIETAELREGEEEELSSLLARYRSAEKILSSLAALRDYLRADGGGVDAVNGAERALNPIAKLDGRYAALLERLENAAAELDDVADVAESLSEELDLDESEVERAEARRDEIRSLCKKYGGSVAAALRFLKEAKREFEMLTDGEARLKHLAGELERTDGELFEACVALTAARKAVAEGFTARVCEELKTLNIPSARFVVQFDEYASSDVGKATSEGLGGVRFLFSANAGEPLKELGKIISGGEMSRFMLAIKAQASASEVSTYIFDEIDAGVGGRTARAIAEKFAVISRGVQVIAVTHLAQIAAYADREFLIEKSERGNKTYTTIRQTEGDDRTAELMRLIGGPPSENVRRHAEELLAEGEAFKRKLRS